MLDETLIHIMQSQIILMILRKEVHELLKMPKALMERFTRWPVSNCLLSSDRRGAYMLWFIIITTINFILKAG